jgi:O-succinylbenzoate-CoA ligase
MRNNVGYLLAKRAFLSPDKEAFVDGSLNARQSYAQFNFASNRIANALKSVGTQKGDRVALLMLNCSEYLELFFATAKIGAVCVPLNIRLAPDELTYMLKDSGARTLVYGSEFQKLVAGVRAKGDQATSITNWIQVGGTGQQDDFALNFEDLRNKAEEAEPELAGFGDDPLFIMYTSGTTGVPKGVVQTHKTVLWAAITMAATAELRHDDRFFIPLPLFHVGALMPAIMSVYFGNTIVSIKMFDPGLCWKVIESERVTNSLMVPTVLGVMLQVLAKAPCDFSSLRWVLIAGAPVPISLLEASNRIGLHVEQLYGLTEACGPGCMLMGDDVNRKVGSAGKPFLFTEVRIVDLDDKDVVPGVPGELIVRGPHVMLKYWNLPEDTTQTLRGGWLHTGDIATVDEDGFIYIVDRLKDMIISGGENIYPAEIEKVIAQIPEVSHVAVIGQSDAKWGEIPIAVLVSSDKNLNEKEVQDYCEGKLARYKIPKSVILVDNMPITPTGKVQKRMLKEQLAKEL